MAKNPITSSDLPKYEKHYSEDGFFDKVGKFAKKAGVTLVYYALVLYYTLIDENTPNKYKAAIAGALGYFIIPLDLIPDFLPASGMIDDWGVLVAAVAYVIKAISPDHKEKAKVKLLDWFGHTEPGDFGDLG